MNQNNNKYKWYREGMESYQRKKLVVSLLSKTEDLLKKLFVISESEKL